MAFTIVDWNVNGFALKQQAELLGRLHWDVALLQEVTRDSWPAFEALGVGAAVAFDHLPALADDGPRYAAAVVVRPPAKLFAATVLDQVPSPERALTASIEVGGRRATVCSWAAPPGVRWGKAGKGRQVARFAAELRGRAGPVVVGIDRNAPKWERLDLADDEWWNKREPLLYGPDRPHDLRDLFREVVDRDEQLRASILDARPDGPLAVTYRRRGTDCRYDAIYASPELEVMSLDHLWDEARGAGSDHALVRATLEWR